MIKLLRACLLALPLLALPAPAHAWAPWRVDVGADWYLRVYSANQQYGWGAQAGPWYSYWPYEAHFQTPAPVNYPFWPAPSSTTGVYPGAPLAVPLAGPSQSQLNEPRGVKAAAYYAEPPAYWYGH